MKGYEFSNNGLSEAIIKRDKEALELFVKADININLTDNEGYSALDRAVKVNNQEAVILLSLAGGQKKKMTDEGIQNQSAKTLTKPDIELNNKNVKIENDTDNSTKVNINNLCQAVNDNNLDLVAKIAAKSPLLNNLSEEGLAPIHYAIFNNNPAMVHVLLNAGADVNILTDDGLTPLDIAVLNNQKIIAKELLESGGALSANVAKELIKFGCKAVYDNNFGLYDAEFDDIFETMQKIQSKIEE